MKKWITQSAIISTVQSTSEHWKACPGYSPYYGWLLANCSLVDSSLNHTPSRWQILTPHKLCFLFQLWHKWINYQNQHSWHLVKGPMSTTAACICLRQDPSSALSSFFSPDVGKKFRDVKMHDNKGGMVVTMQSVLPPSFVRLSPLLHLVQQHPKRQSDVISISEDSVWL